MEDTQILEKIQALKLELAKKQKKLLKLNRRVQLHKKSVKGQLQPITSQLQVNDVKNQSTANSSLSNISDSKNNSSPKNGENFPLPPVHFEPNCNNSMNSGEEELFPDDNQEADDIHEEDANQESDSKNKTNQVFDTGTDLHEKVVCKPETDMPPALDILNCNIQQVVKTPRNCEPESPQQTTNNIDTQIKPSADTETNKSERKEKAERRRSSRISLKSTNDSDSVRKNKKIKLDTRSVISVTFEILCQMGQNLEEKYFTLPDDDDYFNKRRLEITPSINFHQEDIVQDGIICKQENNSLVEEQEMKDTQNIFSETMVPPTLQFKRNIQGNILGEEPESKDTQNIFSENLVPPTLKFESNILANRSFQSLFKAKVPFVIQFSDSDKKAVSSKMDKSSGDFIEAPEDCSNLESQPSKLANKSLERKTNQSVNDGVGDFVKAPKDSLIVENQLPKLSSNNFNVEKTLDQVVENSQEISHICASVLREMVNMLDKSAVEDVMESEKTDNCLHEARGNIPFNEFSFHTAQCLEGPSGDPVENVSLAIKDGIAFAFIQKKQNVSVWEEHDGVWTQAHIYRVLKTEEITNFILLDSSFVILVKGCDFTVRVLAFDQREICLKCEIFLGKQSRGAVSGVLGTLHQDSAFSSCLRFEDQSSQVEVHTVKFDQSTNSIYLEPPDENILGPVVSVLGLPNALLGLGSQKFFFWNITTGLLVRTVVLHRETENFNFEKCIWTKFEKGLLFGVFKEVRSLKWSLVVVNPATGLHNKLCHYTCPVCQGRPVVSHPQIQILQGKVECHKLVSICPWNHLSVFDLLSGSPLIVSKTEDTKVASLNANVLITADVNGSVNTFSIPWKR